MVNRRASTLTLEDTIGSGDADALTKMRATIDKLRHHNQTFEDNDYNIRQCQQESNLTEEMEFFGPQLLSYDIWGALVLEDFKPPSLTKFDGRRDPYEYVASINIQMAFIGEPNYLKCKRLTDTFKDVIFTWYMGLPRTSINSYQELLKKLVHQSATSRHKKMSITNLFIIG